MGLYQRVQQLGSEYHSELMDFYGREPFFPIEVRNLLAPHIEATLCGERELDPNNPSHSLDIYSFVCGIIKILEDTLASADQQIPFFIKHKLSAAIPLLKELLENDPSSVLRRVQECLKFELALVDRAESGQFSQYSPDVLMNNLGFVRKRIEGTGDLIQRMQSEQDAFEINVTEKQNYEDNLGKLQASKFSPDQKAALEAQVKQGISQKAKALETSLQNMMSLRTQFLEGMQSNIKHIGDLHTQILTEKLLVWKFQQQKAANGMAAVAPISLDKVQSYLEQLAEIIWKGRQQVQEIERLSTRNPVFQDAAAPTLLADELLGLLTRTLNDAFVVEDQPQQVMKKGNRFTIPPKCSLLIGNLNIQMSSPQVTTCIIREGQARCVQEAQDIEIAMPIANGVSSLQFNASTRRLSAKFSNLQIREIKRADKRSGGTSSSSSALSSPTAESVMEEKLCMMFESTLYVGELKIRVRTISLPVVVTSHGSQDAMAEATILFDNHFAPMGRLPFLVPHRVPWSELGQVISAKFFTSTGRALTEDNIRCLQAKAFRGGPLGDTITWEEFCKTNLPERNFSFWAWVYAGLKSIEKKETNLKELWREGRLVGFIEREAAAALLSVCEPGTFILRFSDSKAGAITISVLNEGGNVLCIAPLDEAELKHKRLANYIRDLKELQYLYPRIPKHEAFSKYYSVPEVGNSGSTSPYVQPISVIPEDERRRGSGSWGGGSSPWSSPGGTTPIQPPDLRFGMSSQMSNGFGGGGQISSSNPGSPMTQQQQQQPNGYKSLQSFAGMDLLPAPNFQQQQQRIPPDTIPMDENDEMNFEFIDALINEHQDLLQIGPQQVPFSPNSGNSNLTQTTTTTTTGTWTTFVQL